jgi:hypothetical protein
MFPAAKNIITKGVDAMKDGRHRGQPPAPGEPVPSVPPVENDGSLRYGALGPTPVPSNLNKCTAASSRLGIIPGSRGRQSRRFPRRKRRVPPSMMAKRKPPCHSLLFIFIAASVFWTTLRCWGSGMMPPPGRHASGYASTAAAAISGDRKFRGGGRPKSPR